MMAPYCPPLIHFGVLPVQTNTPLSTTASWAAVCGIWEIECELEIEFHHSWDYVLHSTHSTKDTYFAPATGPSPGGEWTGRTQFGYGGIQSCLTKLSGEKSMEEILPLMKEPIRNGQTEEEKYLGFNPYSTHVSGRSSRYEAPATPQATPSPRADTSYREAVAITDQQRHDELRRALEDQKRYNTAQDEVANKRRRPDPKN